MPNIKNVYLHDAIVKSISRHDRQLWIDLDMRPVTGSKVENLRISTYMTKAETPKIEKGDEILKHIVVSSRDNGLLVLTMWNEKEFVVPIEYEVCEIL